MNESPDHNGSADLQEEIAVLRHQLVSTLMLVLGVAVIVTWYFAYQFYFNRTETQRISQATKEKQTQIEAFTSSEPQFQDALRKLRDYSKTHPDVAETLKNTASLNPYRHPPPRPRSK